MMHDKITVPEMVAPRVKGRVKLELRDAETGELTRSIEQDNYVAENWFAAQSTLQQYVFGTVSAASTDSFVTGRRLGANREDFFGDRYPFYGIYLTDYAGAIDTTDEICKGSPVAFGSRGYTTASAGLRGTYSPSESTQTPTYHRYVYDFSTAQGNGTIQSIYTGEFASSGSTATVCPDIASMSTHYSGGSTGGGYDHLGSLQEVALGPKWSIFGMPQTNPTSNTMSAAIHARLNSEALVKPTSISGYPTAQRVTLPAIDLLAFTGTDTHLYWMEMVGYNTTSRTVTVWRATWTDVDTILDSGSFNLTGVTKEAAHVFTHADLNALGWTSLSSSYRSCLVSLTYNEATSTWLLGNIANAAGAPTARYFEYSSAWTLLNSFGTGGGSTIASSLDAIPGETDYYYSGSYTLRLNRTTDTFEYTSRIFHDGGGASVSGHRIPLALGVDLEVGASRQSNASYTQTFLARQQFFSRVRLDAPVEKDSSNTMKVVYEFTIDTPEVFVRP